jgi:hypothetical protein
MTDSHGDEVTVGVTGRGNVAIDTESAACLIILDDEAKQEEFAQLFVAACHRAKADAEAHAAQAGDGR